MAAEMNHPAGALHAAAEYTQRILPHSIGGVRVDGEGGTCMRQRLVTFVVATAILAISGVAYGQGGTTSTLSGTVVDTSGGLIPGADVNVKHNATGVTTTAVSNSSGAFSLPGLNIGTYTVTVTLQGFKTFVVNDVVLNAGSPASVRAVLEVGGITEQVVVSSASEIVQTQSSTISNTINTNQITKLPLTSRSAMDFVTFIPGVSTPGGNRDSIVNGLPQGSINITLDGVNIQDNTLRSTDGFFAIVSPRLDAIEEVTVSTAAQGADSAGQGAVQIRFVTRSGTNDFTGSGYHYYRNDALNANNWFNNRSGVPKPDLLQNQTGGRFGGPIVIPGLFNGRNKAFFFVNYEEFRQPSDTTEQRTILNADAQQGIFRYTAGGQTRTVNLFELAGLNGQGTAMDPVIGRLLSDIRASTAGGSIENIDVNLERFSFNQPVKSLNRYPTVRIDYNLTNSHRFTSSVNYQIFDTFPDTLNNREARFPGFPVSAGQGSKRIGFSNSLRSTLTQSLVNEARVGYSGAPVQFFEELNPTMWGGANGVANQAGFQLNFPNIGSALTGPSSNPTPSSRNATSLLIEDTVTWLKGNHSFSIGGSWTQFDLWAKNQTLVPALSFDTVVGDPARGMFNAANFPGAPNAVIQDARELYALLTGRVSFIDGDARLDENTGQYSYLGLATQRARMREAGFFIQDAWRLRPNFTINAGVRYELQFPFTPRNNSYSTATMADLCGISGVAGDGRSCNLFQPGVTPGKANPEFINFGEGVRAYNVDYDNIAPSVGFAWTTGAESGLLKAILGGPSDAVIRGGYSRAYNRNGMNDFSGQFNANPGIAIQNPDRDVNNGNLNDGAGFPVLLSQAGRLGPAAFPDTPQYPLSEVVTGDINLFDPDIQVPYADSWTVGLQRAVSRNMAVEVRYVGTRSRNNWQVLNYNEVNIVENGFLDEFRRAQANLRANQAAGLGNTFAFTGAPGTAPLPTFLAFFNGSTAVGDPLAYGGGNWTDATHLNFLAANNPHPYGFATTEDDGLLENATFRANAARAGLPANFFLANPALLGGADLTTNQGATNYHSLQTELRRRLAQGLQFNVSYVFGQATESVFTSFRRSQFFRRNTGDEGDITHAVKTNIVYDLPFGQGRRFAGNAGPVLDRIVGGWTVGVNARIQSGQLVDFGNVRLVGMTADDVRNFFRVRIDDAGQKVWMLPQDVIDETIKAFSVSATSATGYSDRGVPTGRYFAPANGPDCIEVARLEDDDPIEFGDCGVRSLVVTGPLYQQYDISVSKRVRLVGRSNFEFRIEMLNAFNHHNFEPVGGLGNDIADFEVTDLTGTNLARTIQLVTRINW
jgi:hypothetical protein